VSVLRSINSNSLPPGGIPEVRRRIHLLQFSLSLFEQQLSSLESRVELREDLQHPINIARNNRDNTARVLQEQQRLEASYEQQENYLRAIEIIQEYLNSL